MASSKPQQLAEAEKALEAYRVELKLRCKRIGKSIYYDESIQVAWAVYGPATRTHEINTFAEALTLKRKLLDAIGSDAELVALRNIVSSLKATITSEDVTTTSSYLPPPTIASEDVTTTSSYLPPPTIASEDVQASTTTSEDVQASTTAAEDAPPPTTAAEDLAPKRQRPRTLRPSVSD